MAGERILVVDDAPDIHFLTALGISTTLGVGIVAVLVASFAATTLDTATRLQRYVIQELAGTLHVRPLQGKYAATAFAVITGGVIAMMPHLFSLLIIRVMYTSLA